jgi:hypothetical protein
MNGSPSRAVTLPKRILKNSNCYHGDMHATKNNAAHPSITVLSWHAITTILFDDFLVQSAPQLLFYAALITSYYCPFSLVERV